MPSVLDEAKDWFRDKVMEAGTAPSLINAAKDYGVSAIVPGSMYLYVYDPKYKATLPMYDKYPLCLPISSDGDTFLGLNMHYLNPLQRMSLFNALSSLRTNSQYDETTRINMSYQLLSSSAKFKFFDKALHKYLYSHVRSRFLLIPPKEWRYAMSLPLAEFVYNK